MEPTDVETLHREYRLSVTPEDRDRLMQAASLVDSKMRSIRDGGRVNSIDRIAVLAALQFAHQILGDAQVADASPAGEAGRKLRKINENLAEELKRQDDLF
mgnify:CR=1 FL=1